MALRSHDRFEILKAVLAMAEEQDGVALVRRGRRARHRPRGVAVDLVADAPHLVPSTDQRRAHRHDLRVRARRGHRSALGRPGPLAARHALASSEPRDRTAARARRARREGHVVATRSRARCRARQARGVERRPRRLHPGAAVPRGGPRLRRGGDTAPLHLREVRNRGEPTASSSPTRCFASSARGTCRARSSDARPSSTSGSIECWMPR